LHALLTSCAFRAKAIKRRAKPQAVEM